MTKAPSKLQARALVGMWISGVRVEANDIVTASADVINHYVDAGEMDKSKAAVDYCVDNKSASVDLTK